MSINSFNCAKSGVVVAENVHLSNDKVRSRDVYDAIRMLDDNQACELFNSRRTVKLTVKYWQPCCQYFTVNLHDSRL